MNQAPGMVGSSQALDAEILTNRLWTDELSPDALKIYPCILLKNLDSQRELAKYIKSPDWTPLTDESYLELLTECLPSIPPYVHINRIQRLIQPGEILLGPKRVIDRQRFGGISRCLWQRSVAQCNISLDSEFTQYSVREYPQGHGYCIEATCGDDIVVGYARLSFYNDQPLIRDIRVLGNMLPVGCANSELVGTQHIGIGKAMMARMESMSKERGYQAIALHPAAGVRSYFERLGYQQTNCDYLLKRLRKLPH